MKASDRAVAMIKHFEGYAPEAYADGSSHSVGYGSNGVPKGTRVTPQEAEELLRKHIAGLQDQMTDLIDVDITQAQFDALVSFVYNVGINAFSRSTLLKKLNKGDKEGAANELLKWVNANGFPSKGLTVRRQAERELFLS